MDQGSYSRPDGRGQPTLSASSAAKNNYQVNVSRQKTKKWVEAKSQNYDGDDWGADEYEDDEVEPPQPLTPRGPQYGASQASADLPSLHVQTNPSSQPPQKHQPYPPPQSRPPPPTNTQTQQESNTPSAAHPSPAVPQSAGGFQPQSASSTYPLSPRSPPDSLPSTTPQAASASKPLPFVRPSDIYRRMEEEKSRASSESSRPSAEIPSNLSKQSSASPARTAAEPVKPQPPTVPVPAPRTDSRNIIYQDLTMPANRTSQQPPAAGSPRSVASQFVTPGPNAAPHMADEEAKRLSTSPKLPDLARMSVFGADFFSNGFSSLSSEQMAEQKIPEVPKVAPQLKVDKPTTHEVSHSPADTPKASTNKTEAAPAAPAATEKTSVKDEVIEPTVHQPLAGAARMTESRGTAMPAEPKPSDPAKQAATRSSMDTESSSRSAASVRDITPTKPLNVRKDDSPVRSFEPPRPLQRESTFGTDTSSPVKESDVLRDEIIKTLNSPSQPSKEGVEAAAADGARKGSESRTRDSTYTLQDYDSYWDDADTAPDGPAQPSKTMSVVPEEATEAAAATGFRGPAGEAPKPSEPTEEPKPAATPPHAQPAAAAQPTPRESASQPSALPAVSPELQSSSPQQPPDAAIVSPVSTDLRRRFSWEAEDASKPSPTALGIVPLAATAPPPVPAPAPAPALAVTAMPSSEPKPQPESPSTLERQSATSPVNAATIPTVVATDTNSPRSKRLSLADEKALSTTVSNEVSASADEHPALRLSDPAPAPALSMPRTSGGNVTPFKDIVNLNNSSERVAKFNETRVAFAVMDIGLDKWLTNLHHDHPEHHSKSFNSYQPSATSPTGVPSGAQSAQQPYYQQYLNASTPGSGPTPGRRIGGIHVPSNVGGSTFGHSGNQIGTKSKELMHSAGKMGKGLFSKGKNKLRGDKGDTLPPPPTKAKHERSGSWAVLSSKLRTEFSSAKEHEHPQQHSQQPQEQYSAAPRPSVTIAPQIPVPEPVSPLLREASPDKSLPPVPTSAQPTARGNQFAASGMSAAPPLTSPIPPSSQIRIVPSETAPNHVGVGAQGKVCPAAEDSGVGMLTQPDESDDAPKRQSSFVGLPPIRRSSTFGLKPKTRRAAERFPLDEEEGNDIPDLPTSDVMEHAPSQADVPQQPHHEPFGATNPASSFPATSREGVVAQHQPVSAERSPERPARQPTMATPPQAQPTRQPIHPPMMMYPAQSGPWRLEESHLAEPLHQAKNRSGHSPISPTMSFGFEKETGHSAMMPPPPLPASIARQRNTDVPPSSAQRYPGLFAPRPDEEFPQRPTSQSYYEEKVNPRHGGNEYSLPGVGPPTEERGRAKRNSGIFREIGDKIARATSRDRRQSFAENQHPADAHADATSESSFGAEEMQDRKKRRSSFFNALTGRASMDQSSHHGLSSLQRSQTESLPLSSSEDLGSARKRSMLSGVMTGFGARRDSSSNAPTSGLASQQVADDELPLTPKKKRFSGIAKAFQRPNQERPSSGMSTASEHNRRASFSNLLSTLTGNKGQQHEQQEQQLHAAPPQHVGAFPSNDLPQDIPPAPQQVHPADGFPTPNRDAAPAAAPPDDHLGRPQPPFAAPENKWGIERPPTSTTVTPNEPGRADAGVSGARSAAIPPATSTLPLRTTDPSTQHADHATPSEISDSETDMTEHVRKPSDVTSSVVSHISEHGADMTRRDTNVSQVTPSVVTDVPREDEQRQTPTAQYPNSPGGYLALNSRVAPSSPLSAGSQGYPQEQLMQHQQGPRGSLSGPSFVQDTTRPATGPQYGQHAQHQMQPGFGQPVQRTDQGTTSPKGWRGLKTKMAGQMASMGQLSPNSKNQDKGSKGDKPATGDKLMSAFKRLSKQQSSPPPPQQGAAPGSAPGREHPQPFQVFARSHGQPIIPQSQQMPQQMQYQHAPAHNQQGFPQQQTPIYMQQQTEPQYAAVPIPQGYTAAYGHGSVQAPTTFNGQPQYPQRQTSFQQQRDYASQYQPSPAVMGSQQQGNGVTPTQTQFQPLQTESPPISQQPRASESDPLSPVSTAQRSGSMAFSPSSDEVQSPRVALTREALAQQDARKDLPVPYLRPGDSHTSLGPSNSNRVSQVSNDSRQHGPSPKSDQQSPAVSHKQLQDRAASPTSPGRERHISSASVSPPAGSIPDVASPSLAVAAPAAPATPLARDLTGESRGQVSDDSVEHKAKLDKAAPPMVTTAATQHVAELEDTAEARQRTIRMDSQEEKIAYDPEEENPKMAATSYPGQEWNPYGEPGFGDWHE